MSNVKHLEIIPPYANRTRYLRCIQKSKTRIGLGSITSSRNWSCHCWSKHLVDRLIIGLLANGHVLLEGVPGLAKTLSIKTLSDAIQTEFKRIQLDLLPADILGTLIYNPAEGEFTTKKGPIFANLILADEINRAPARCKAHCLKQCRKNK